MATFMVVSTFRPDTDMAEVATVVADEVARVAALRRDQLIGAVHICTPRRVVFIEVFAPDAQAATETVLSLPMARWWDLDVYPTTAPALPGGPAAATA